MQYTCTTHFCLEVYLLLFYENTQKTAILCFYYDFFFCILYIFIWMVWRRYFNVAKNSYPRHFTLGVYHEEPSKPVLIFYSENNGMKYKKEKIAARCQCLVSCLCHIVHSHIKYWSTALMMTRTTTSTTVFIFLYYYLIKDMNQVGWSMICEVIVLIECLCEAMFDDFNFVYYHLLMSCWFCYCRSLTLKVSQLFSILISFSQSYDIFFNDIY